MTTKITANNIITALSPALTKPVIQCPFWVKQAATLAYPPNPKYGRTQHKTTAATFHPELCIRIPNRKTNRFGKPKPQNRYVDLLALVQAHYKITDPLIIGVEIKVAKSDLMNDKKIKDYLPYCHLFYLAVPHWMETLAYQKLKQDKLTTVGLLLIDTAQNVTVAKLPTLTTVTMVHQKEVCTELLFRPIKRLRDNK